MFVIIGGLVVLALTAALVGPYFVDWTSYRANFERAASRILGRQVTVAGEARARILPFPSVTFTDVKVAGESPEKPAMTIETFSMDAELAPFMRGEILIFDMRLHKPVMTVDIAENGLIDWTIRSNAPFDASQITFENISVTDGQVTVHHAGGGRSYLLDDINADISAQTLSGPWRFNGGLEFDGSALSVALSTGTVADDGTMRLRMHVEPADLPVQIETDGNVKIADGGAIYSGLFRLEAAKQNKSDEQEEDAAFAISIEGSPEPVIPFRVTGKFTADHQLVDVGEFLFETGNATDPYSAEGTAYLDFGKSPSFSVQAKGQQVRFDDEARNTGGGSSLASRIAALRDMIQRVPKPRFPGTINVDLPAIVTGDTTIRQVKLEAQPNDGGWTIGNFSAELPGRSTLEAHGLLTTGGDFGFHGSLLLAVNQPSGFAAWLSEDVDEAIRRLPSAGFSARVDIDRERQTLRDLELILGGARFTGEIDHLLPANARPSMLLRLDGGALDVDGLAAFASIFIDDSGAARFADHDLDFVIKAGPVSAGGLTAQSVDTAMRLKEGLLDIDRLSVGDIAGATLSATGKLRNFPDSPTGNLDASIVAVDLEPLAALLAARYPQNPFAAGLAARAETFPGLLSETNIDMVASAAANDDGSLGMAISAHGVSGGNKFTVSGSGTARGGVAEGPLSMTLTMQSDDAAPLFAAYGLPAAPLGLTGPAETSFRIAGEAGGLFETTLLLRGEDSEATFEGWTGLADGSWQATGKVHVKSGNVEPWLATAGVTLPGYGYGLPIDISADLDHEKDTLKLAHLTGTLENDAISGDLVAEFSAAKPVISGSAALPSFDLYRLITLLLGEEGMQMDADGRPGATPFASAPDLPFAANVDLKVARLDFGAADPLENAELALAAGDNAIRISGLKARYRDGRITGLLDLKNNGGTALISTQFRYSDARLADLASADAISGKVTLSADLNANGKSLAGLMASLSGAGTGSLEGAALPGVNPEVFGEFIEAADQKGKAISADDVAGFAPGLVASGPFAARDTDFTFVVAGGMLRTPSIALAGGKAGLEGELTVDFNAWEANASAEITYDAGREALVGAVPAVRISATGPIGAMVATYDTGPLAQFLTQRALEIEQHRVEALQAGLLEKQRLRREVRYYASLEDKRLMDAQEAADQREEGATSEPDASGADSGGESVSTPDPTAGTLEDDIRRVLDEAAANRVDEDANAVNGEQPPEEVAVTDGVISQPLPDIVNIPQPDRAGTAENPAPPVFQNFRSDRMSIDTFLRTQER